MNEPSNPNVDENGIYIGTTVYQTDSDEWKVYIFKASVLVTEEYSVDSPYHLPTRDEARVLRTIKYGVKDQRYLTDDGYTFGMPSASVTKAGTKTRYSVLGLWRRRTIIDIGF